jgi:hypothetical protein
MSKYRDEDVKALVDDVIAVIHSKDNDSIRSLLSYSIKPFLPNLEEELVEQMADIYGHAAVDHPTVTGMTKAGMRAVLKHLKDTGHYK